MVLQIGLRALHAFQFFLATPWGSKLTALLQDWTHQTALMNSRTGWRIIYLRVNWYGTVSFIVYPKEATIG